MNLYDLSQDYLRLIELIDEEDDNALNVELAKVGDSINTKIEKLALVIRTLEAQSAAIKSEVERLDKRSAALGNHAKRIKAYIQDIMGAVALKKVQGVLASVTLQAGRESVRIVDESLIPGNFKYVQVKKSVVELTDEERKKLEDEKGKLDFVVSKEEIMDLHKDGVDIPGVEFGKTPFIVIR